MAVWVRSGGGKNLSLRVTAYAQALERIGAAVDATGKKETFQHA